MKHPQYTLPLLVLSAAVQNADARAIPTPDTATMTRDQGSVDIAVLENDDSDLETGGNLFINDYTQPAYGSVVAYGGIVTYTPNESFTGTDVFTYEVLDESGYGGFANVSVTVTDPEPEPGILEPYAVGSTNKSIARVMDDLCTSIPSEGGGETLAGVYNVAAIPTDSLFDACGGLYEVAQNSAVLNAVLREIAPEEALTQRDLLAENSRNKTSRLYRAIASMRAGRNASLSINGTALPFGGAAGDNLGSPWTLFSSLQVDSFEHDQTGNEAGYESDAKGLMLGLGYRMSGDLNVGAAFDWMTYDVGYDADSGDLDSDIYSLTGFLSWYRNALALDLQLGYTSGDTNAQRRFETVDPEAAFADSDYGSDQLDASAQLDWSWQRQAWTLRPFLRLDYLKSNIDAFSETGTSAWLVAVEKQSHEQLNTSAGLDTSYTLTYSWGVMVPSVKLSLVNQANLSNSPVAFQLVNEASELGRFELRADSPDSLFYQWDLTSTFILANGLSTFFGAQILSGYDGVSAYQVNGGVNWEF